MSDAPGQTPPAAHLPLGPPVESTLTQDASICELLIRVQPQTGEVQHVAALFSVLRPDHGDDRHDDCPAAGGLEALRDPHDLRLGSEAVRRASVERVAFGRNVAMALVSEA